MVDCFRVTFVLIIAAPIVVFIAQVILLDAFILAAFVSHILFVLQAVFSLIMSAYALSSV